jgi:hypothetical protein
MEDRSNKTIICSVLFLDIVEYSKKSVAGQISLKDRFNTYLSEAIHDVPVSDRIILDTGDGAAINFLGDVEAALNAALRLRARLLAEDPEIDPQLLVRIGINLGPVRLVRDINGQPNIVGDGINVAQRVMGFADASQILVSRSYYDAVSRLSSQYTGMFHHQGSRTDKHVREHEIYAIGYPGDQTTKHVPSKKNAVKAAGRHVAMLDRIGRHLAALPERIKQVSAVQRLLYAAIAALLAGVVAYLWPVSPPEAVPPVETMQGAASAVSAVAAAPAAKEIPKEVPKEVPPKAAPAQGKLPSHPVDKSRRKADSPVDKQAAPKPVENRIRSKTPEAAPARVESAGESQEVSDDAYISVSCKESSQVFVDGVQKGRTGAQPLLVTVKAGTHKLIIHHASYGIYSVDVVLEAGKTRNLKPKECN